MSGITTHVLDTARGRPAEGVPVVLSRQSEDGWEVLGQGRTDANGRLSTLLPPNAALSEGTYWMTFDTSAYFDAQGVEGFYPFVTVVFKVTDAGAHYHVPLLLSPYGYSTYRGS